ncbi:hypothetical protein B9G69_004760 [Bdellovibrio sp. SKB1291214]|uniref:hypothetical protein n=1 Tax=Bdellovibrio sp. SKB1291214 TaxID=1732569 RepID=UPI000B51B458|nr:hypothetical protein [Bdellovibrio sp. SKB1291214]UYL09884.1 hypothetical protein B9G69_004760 [Bdellovibrio sp. SKB1291214]
MKKIVVVILVLFGGTISAAKENLQNQEAQEAGHHHDEKTKEGHTHSSEGKDHEKEDEDHHDEHGNEDGAHGQHEEESSSIGPDKGITTYSEADGFKLSPEAVKNFELQTFKIKNVEPWNIPNSSVLYSGEEINIYRMRNGFFKRIDFSIVSKGAKEMKIRTPELKSGDEIVIQGVAFLRTAEIVATGGAPEGHSH